MQRADLLLCLSLALASATAHADAQADTVRSGRALYNSVGCWACHGYDAPGTLSGPQLSATPLPLPAFQRLLRHPAKLMPAYSPQLLSDSQVADILSYLQSLPAATPAQSIKLLKP